MPDGLTHLTIGIIGGGALLIATAYYAPEHVTPVAIGTAIGLIVTPDLDQDGRTVTESIMLNIPVVGRLFQWSWYPYATLFRHRGLSHNILIGTAGRMLYVMLLLIFWATVAIGIGWLYDGQPVDWVAALAPLVERVSAGLLVAWWVQDALHIIADKAGSKTMQRGYLIIAGVLVLAAVVLLAWTLTADAGDAVPRTIRVTATLENVVCKLPICCGYASATYHGRYYDTGVSGYCKWLRPGRSWPTLRNGQRELMTLTLTRRVGR